MSLEDYVYTEIKNAIFNKKIPLHYQLNEELLSDAFKVSRTPIRAVLKRMKHEKIVYSIPNKGTYIYQPNQEEIDDVFQLRIIMEKKAVEIACQNASDEQLDKLEGLTAQEEEEYSKGEYGKGIELTSQFHQKLIELSSNKLMAAYNQELLNITNIYLVFHDIAKRECPLSPEEHRSIIHALRKRDIDASIQAVDDHYESVIKNLKYQGPDNDVQFKEIFKPYSNKNTKFS